MMAKSMDDLKSEIAQLKLEKVELTGRLKEAINLIGVLTQRSLHWGGEHEKMTSGQTVGADDK